MHASSSVPGLTGLFLGAGASFESGMPLVWDLTAKLNKYLQIRLVDLNAKWKSEGGGYPDNIISDLIGAIKNPDMHYEALIGYIETQVTRQRQFTQEYEHLRSWLINGIYGSLYLPYFNERAFIEDGLRFLDGIIGLAQLNEPLWIFSLNHDLIIECLAVRHRVRLSAGLRERSIICRRLADGTRSEVPVETLKSDDFASSGLNFLRYGEHGLNGTCQ